MAVVRTPPNQPITVLPHVQRFCDDLEYEVGAKSFGTYKGHSPPEGPSQAVDIHVPVSPTTLGDAVARFAIDNYKKYGVRYIIWRQRIWNEEIGAYWRQMADQGNQTLNHFDHGHVTFYSTADNFEEDDMFLDEDRQLLLQVKEQLGWVHDISKQNNVALRADQAVSKVDEIKGGVDRVSMPANRFVDYDQILARLDVFLKKNGIGTGE